MLNRIRTSRAHQNHLLVTGCVAVVLSVEANIRLDAPVEQRLERVRESSNRLPETLPRQ